MEEFFATLQAREFDLLYMIRTNLQCPFMDDFVKALSKIAGNYGHLWVVLGIVLLIFRKTRKAGFSVLLSYALVYLTGQLGLKDLIARERPCSIDTAVQLIVSRPSSYSCPSTHTAWAFAAATAVFMHKKSWGLLLCIPAAVIGFSRLYLFVHFPTDVLLGAVLGILMGVLAAVTVRAVSKGIARRKAFKA